MVHAVTEAPLMSLKFTLPWPPSVNTYWRHNVIGGDTKKARETGKFKKPHAAVFLSEGGRNYRTHAILSMNVQRVPKGALRGRLAVHIVAYPPDQRGRDLDNLPKGVLDALKHAGVIRDDEDIDDLHIVRGPVRRDGLLDMLVSEIAHEPVQAPLLPGEYSNGTSMPIDSMKKLRKAMVGVDRPTILDRDPF